MRPEVRIIDHQIEEVRTADIPQSEAEALLAKYNYNQNTNNNPMTSDLLKNEETFEEMVKREEDKKRPPQTPKRIDGYSSETKWSSDIESGINFKIEVITDMKIPKY